jgi:CelD/BcsL family acetyltransferase involved in cellulose biosynthesis
MDQPSQSEIEFRYFLGDLCFLRMKFRARIERQPFEPDADSLLLALDFPSNQGDEAVTFYPGRRITERQSTIRATRRAIRYIRNQRTSHYIDLRRTFQDYLKDFSAKRRGNLQREIRKLTAMAAGTFECRIYRGPEKVSEFHALARKVAVKTYQEKLFGGAIPGTPEFVARLNARAQDDSYRGFILMVKGEPVSYVYLPIVDDRIVDFQYLGYDPEFSEWSPGTVLLYLALESVFSEGTFRYFNLSYGEGQMKRVFGRAGFLQADVYFFRWTLRNVLAVYGHAFTDWFSSKIGLMLEKLGLRRRMRLLLRRLPGKKAETA